MFEGLAGDFYKDTWWKVFFSADKSWFPTVSEIYNPEPVFWVENECVWSKMTFFRWLEVLGGTFVRAHMSQICLGCIVEVF